MPPSSKTSSVGRIVGLVLILVLIVVMAPVASYLGTAFGWTNPSQTPPGGSGILTALNGNLGINDQNPQTALSVNGTITTAKVTGLTLPETLSDAANKEYVDANGGGSAGALTLYGVGLQGGQGVFQRAGGAIGAGCRGVYGGLFTAGCTPGANVPAGTNAPACPSGWTEAMLGYGPMNTFFSWYGMANQDTSGQSGDQIESNIPDTAVIGTDSICSSVSYALMYDVTYAQAGGATAVYGGSSMLSACNNLGCNTCRICVK
jgi:hypothetical protein